MKTMTAKQFIKTNLNKGPGRIMPVRAYIQEPGFNTMYVRLSARRIDGELVFPVFDVASVEANKKGAGVFTKFIKDIRSSFPDLPIIVESVVNRRFANYLPKLGFEIYQDGLSPTFLWRPHEEKPRTIGYSRERSSDRTNSM